MEKYEGFDNWLKANHYVSRKSYLSLMNQIEKTLPVKDFDMIRSPSILERLLREFTSKRTIMAMSKVDKDVIIAGFRAYIEYIRSTKDTPVPL